MECVQILAVITPEFSVTWSFFAARDISCYQGQIISMFNKRVLTIFSLFHHGILENICLCATSFLHMCESAFTT